jgi:hypothetical protein
MSKFLEIPKLEHGPVKYILHLMNYEENFMNWSIRMDGLDFPRSIYIKEFDYLKNLIINKNLKNGFECGTAFGVSTVALGLGFKKTKGHLVTMDAYIEETTDNCYDYREFTNKINFESIGYKSVNFLIEHFRLKKYVKTEIGWSPNDVGKLIKDLRAVKPFLDDNYVIALHDCFSYLITTEVEDVIQLLFGVPLEIVVTGTDGYNLAIIDNKK